jgi:hypothetical protein
MLKPLISPEIIPNIQATSSVDDPTQALQEDGQLMEEAEQPGRVPNLQPRHFKLRPGLQFPAISRHLMLVRSLWHH